MSECLDTSYLIWKKVQATLFVSPSLIFLKGVAKLKNLQDEVSYILVCAAEAWWAHNPQVTGSKPLEEQIPLEEINNIDNYAYANYLTKKGPNAQGAIRSSVMLSCSHLEESVNVIRKVVPRGCISHKGFIIQSKYPLLG